MLGFRNVFHLLLSRSSPSRLFRASRGLRQGDPLSPFLFTIVVEALRALLSKAKECGILEGFEFGKGVEAITHLQFANDTILFSSTRWEEVVVLKRILRCFELYSSLKINLSKSLMMGVGTMDEEIQTLASKFHRKSGKLPLFYLDLPIGGKVRSKEVW